MMISLLTVWTLLLWTSIYPHECFPFKAGYIPTRPNLPFNTYLKNSDGSDNNNSEKKVLVLDKDVDTKNIRKILEPFAAYAWEKLESTEDLVRSVTLAEDLRSNTGILSANKGTVDIEVKALHGSENESAIRLARYALLWTSPSTTTASIEVLNLVIFPSPDTDLPVFGADLVLLPGNKNLMLIDFQPVSSNSTLPTGEGLLSFPENSKFEEKLKEIHHRHQTSLPWGGDIPPNAKRFISPYALWTRIESNDLAHTIETDVFTAFKEYFDLYLDLCTTISMEKSKSSNKSAQDFTSIHEEYLTYRRDNDPARPMLRRLYGEEWSERLIEEVLFEPLQGNIK